MAIKKYESDAGSIHSLRLSKDKAAVANNTEPTGNVDSNVKPQISKSNRSYGLRPRGVRISRELTGGSGDSAVTKTVYSFIPVLKKDTLGGTNFSIGKDVTYKSNTWKIIAEVAEDY